MGARTYALWQDGPWKVAEPGSDKKEISSSVERTRKKVLRRRSVNTKDIIEKNLFHPERSAGKLEETENVSGDSIEGLKGLVLLGTVITSAERYALVRLSPGTGRSANRGKRRSSGRRQTKGDLRRLALGDTLEGFQLAEVHPQRVVFKKGSSKVEVALDFSRKAVKEAEKKVKSRKARRAPKARRRIRTKGKEG